jgi:sodium/hydrogen antiporter
VALVFVIRPAVAWVALGRVVGSPASRGAVSFFGVRGVGSLYYLAYATGQATFEQAEVLWATVAFTILVSVVVHGVSAGPAMEWVDRHR